MAKYSVQMPYEGDEKFIFVSYSHKNKIDAELFIARLQHDGYRVWYDEGIHPGSEWDEFIATHVETCELFFALMSEEYMQSDNCKDELNFARDLNKNRVLIFFEEVKMPAGMRLRLGRLQNIHKNQYADEERFYQKLFLTDRIQNCYAEKEEQEIEHILAAVEPNQERKKSSSIPSIDTLELDSVKDQPIINQETIAKVTGDELQESIETSIIEPSVKKQLDNDSESPNPSSIQIERQDSITVEQNRDSTKKALIAKVSDPKNKDEQPQYIRTNTFNYFNQNVVKRIYGNSIPDEIRITGRYDIILSFAFASLLNGEKKSVKRIIVSRAIDKVQDNAFYGLIIEDEIEIPESVSSIGNNAFVLGEKGKVRCIDGSYAYEYCKRNGLRNTVDIENWISNRKCQYCGGDFSGFLRKKCKVCGREKDY